VKHPDQLWWPGVHVWPSRRDRPDRPDYVLSMEAVLERAQRLGDLHEPLLHGTQRLRL
jgi:hypothetical protein